MQAILESPATFQHAHHAYSAPIRIIGLVAMIIGVLVAAGIAGAVMLVKLPITLITGR